VKPRNWSYRAPRIGALAVVVWGLSACGTGSGGSGAAGSGGSGAAAGGGGGAPTGGSTGSGGSSSAGQGGDLGSGGASGGTAGAGATGGSAATGGAAGGSGMAGAGAAGSSGAGGSGGTGGRHTGGAGGGGLGGGAGGTSAGAATFDADRVIVTGVRGTTSPAATSTITLHNGGSQAVQVTGLSVTQTAQLAMGPSGTAAQATATPLGGTSPFTIASPTSFPASLGAGMDLVVTVQMSTTASNLPAPPSDKNLGCTFLTATLTANVGSTPIAATVYGLLLIQDNYEATLGQILVALGYKLNVGKAQTNWNPNTSMNAVDLPGVESGTDEVAAPLFVKAGTGPVTLTIAARFSPVGALPYGWYPSTSVATLNMVGTLSMITDAQTSDKARMVYPPLQAGSATTFDPGSASFGLWIYSDQKTEKYKEGGNTINGDYDYTQDGPNAPAGVHRVKSYPLKDAAGTAIPHQFLVAIEEAGNGDYQDYVFVLGNVSVAP
jgi:hypothetical protein